MPSAKGPRHIDIKTENSESARVTGSRKFILKTHLKYGPRRKKTCLRGFANNTSADQPAHPRSLISAFVVHFLESIIRKLASGEI